MEEREGVLGGPCHLVNAALFWTLKVRTWMSRQQGKGRGHSIRLDSVDDELSLLDGSPDPGASHCRASSDRSQHCCPGLATGASAKGYAGGCEAVSTRREWVCVCVCVCACVCVGTLLQAWCHA